VLAMNNTTKRAAAIIHLFIQVIPFCFHKYASNKAKFTDSIS